MSTINAQTFTRLRALLPDDIQKTLPNNVTGLLNLGKSTIDLATRASELGIDYWEFMLAGKPVWLDLKYIKKYAPKKVAKSKHQVEKWVLTAYYGMTASNAQYEDIRYLTNWVWRTVPHEEFWQSGFVFWCLPVIDDLVEKGLVQKHDTRKYYYMITTAGVKHMMNVYSQSTL